MTEKMAMQWAADIVRLMRAARRDFGEGLLKAAYVRVREGYDPRVLIANATASAVKDEKA